MNVVDEIERLMRELGLPADEKKLAEARAYCDELVPVEEEQ